jgi:hypothetical protein
VVPLPVGAAARLCVFRVGAEANSIQNTGAAGYRGTNKAATGGAVEFQGAIHPRSVAHSLVTSK